MEGSINCQKREKVDDDERVVREKKMASRSEE